jgi:transcriptional regulator with XRE-family HTH domain
MGNKVRTIVMVANGIDLAIGARIRRQRKTLRMSISDLSKNIGVSEFEIAQFENGNRRLSAPILVRLCKIFGVGIAYFFDSFELDVKNETAIG